VVKLLQVNKNMKPSQRWTLFNIVMSIIMTICVGTIVFFLAFIGGILYISQNMPKDSLNELPEPSNHILVTNNTLEAVVMPYYLEPIIYTSLSEKIIQCESGGNQKAIGRAGEIGVAQFMKTTWDWMCQEANYFGDINNEEDQRYMLNWALKNGLASHWTCFNIVIK